MSEIRVERLGVITGRARNVSVRLTGLSFRQTGTERRYPYPDFGADFIDALHQALVAPRRRGLFRSRLVCPTCDSSLDAIVMRPVSFTTEVAPSRIPPIRIDLEMPGIKCPGCSRSLVMINDRAVDSDLSDALIAAFDSVSLRPG